MTRISKRFNSSRIPDRVSERLIERVPFNRFSNRGELTDPLEPTRNFGARFRGLKGTVAFSGAGVTLATCPVRDDVRAEIFLDYVASGGKCYTYLRCFDTSGDIPVAGTAYRLDVNTAVDGAVKYTVGICQMEDNRLCVHYVEESSGRKSGVQIVNIETAGLDVDSVGTWTAIGGDGEWWSIRVAKARTDQVVAIRSELTGDCYARAITFDGDDVDTQGSDLTITDMIRSEAWIVSKSTGKVVYAQHVTDNANSMEVGRLDVAVNNAVTLDYKGNFADHFATNVYQSINIDYDSDLDLFLVSYAKNVGDGFLCSITDTGSALTVSAIDTWVGLTGSGSGEIFASFDGDGKAIALMDDDNTTTMIFDRISFSGVTPSFDDAEIEIDSLPGRSPEAAMTTDNKIFFIWGSGAFGDVPPDETKVRFYLQ